MVKNLAHKVNKKLYVLSILGITIIALVVIDATGVFAVKGQNLGKNSLTAGITSSSGASASSGSSGAYNPAFGHSSPTGYCPYVAKAIIPCADRKPPSPPPTNPPAFLVKTECNNSDLRLVYGMSGVGTGNAIDYTLFVVNTSTKPCYLPAPPPVDMIAANGQTTPILYDLSAIRSQFAGKLPGGSQIDITPGNNPLEIYISVNPCSGPSNNSISVSFPGGQQTISGEDILSCPTMNANIMSLASSGVLNSTLTAPTTTTGLPSIPSSIINKYLPRGNHMTPSQKAVASKAFLQWQIKHGYLHIPTTTTTGSGDNSGSSSGSGTR